MLHDLICEVDVLAEDLRLANQRLEEHDEFHARDEEG